MRPITRRQADALAFIRSYIAEHSCAPTYQEIADALGISKSGVCEYVAALIEKGHIEMRRGWRGIALVGRCPGCGRFYSRRKAATI